MNEIVTLCVTLVHCLATTCKKYFSVTTAREELFLQRSGEMQSSFRDNDLLELLKNKFPGLPENRSHGRGVC